MSHPTTIIDLTSVVVTVISSATTWANTKGASLNDPISLVIHNPAAIPVRITGNSAATTASAGMTVLTTGYASYELKRGSDALFAITSNSTATITVQADR